MAGEVSFQPTEQDYAAANRELMVRRLGRPYRTENSGLVTLFALIAGLLVLVACAQVPFLAPYVDGVFRLVGYVAAGGLALYALCLLANYLLLPRYARRLFRQQKPLHKPLHYAWSDDGISYSTANGSGSLGWGELYSWSYGPRTFLFLVNEQLFYFIPRRALTDAQAQDLQATAEARGPARF